MQIEIQNSFKKHCMTIVDSEYYSYYTGKYLVHSNIPMVVKRYSKTKVLNPSLPALQDSPLIVHVMA